MSSTYYIPEELIFKILSSLPVKSLVRFSSVCKSWRSIISNPQFIRKHLTHSLKKHACVAIFDWKTKNLINSIYICTLEDSIGFNLPPVNFRGINKYMCSCHGLVCLTNTNGDIVCVWNPSTKWFKILPTPKRHSKLYQNHKLGFVFDCISNDYKIIKFTIDFADDDLDHYIIAPPRTGVFTAEMYSSNGDSWKEILVPTTMQSFRPYSESQCVNFETGVMYLDGYNNESLSFDWHNEVFAIYKFPDPKQYGRKSNVFDFRGSVSMIFESIDNRSLLSLWMLDDDTCGGKVSWTKKFNLPPADPKINWIFLYLDVEQTFVAKNDIGYIFYDYKMEDNNYRFLPQSPAARELTSVVKYTGSLVSLEEFVKQTEKGKQ